MARLYLSVLCLICLIPVYMCAAKKPDKYYTGAVVEYHSLWDDTKKAEENVRTNADNYRRYIEAAHEKKVDIIVFPEMGLLGVNSSVFIPVPSPHKKITPRLDGNQHEVLNLLSEAAYENKIYVVVNLLEESVQDGKKVNYNTNVIFDRNGTIIARYRKYNLFEEPYVNKTVTPDYSFFDTDFGVRFGTFTCFDILFKEPAFQLIRSYNVTDFVYPTSWFSETPFLLATQVQGSWSYAMDVNLLASGQNNVSNYHSGSGIYGGKQGPLIYRQSESDESFMLVHKVHKKDVEDDSSSSEEDSSEESSEEGRSSGLVRLEPIVPGGQSLRLFSENLTSYSSVLFDPDYSTMKTVKESRGHHQTKEYFLMTTVCHQNVCCDFRLSARMKYGPDNTSLDALSTFRYRLVAFDGVRYFGREDLAGTQVCGIVPCLDADPKNCSIGIHSNSTPSSVRDDSLGTLYLQDIRFTYISINTSFHAYDSLILPDVLLKSKSSGTFGRLPSRNIINFETTPSEEQFKVKLRLHSKKHPIPLFSAAIYSRLFSRDSKVSIRDSSFINS